MILAVSLHWRASVSVTMRFDREESRMHSIRQPVVLLDSGSTVDADLDDWVHFLLSAITVSPSDL